MPPGCRLLFRFAGDEFVALVTGPVGEAEVVKLAGQLIATLSEPFTIDDRRIQIGAP